MEECMIARNGRAFVFVLIILAKRDAESALKMVPYWHYVRDILMAQIRAAQARAH